jgi:hypothetical protein
MAKAIEINSKIIIYNELPKVWENKTVTSDSQYYIYGFRDVVIPDTIENQYLGELYLDKVLDVYTYEIIDRTQTQIDIEFSIRKLGLVKKIDSDTDEFIKSVIGERANEYEIAEREATLFKEAGYPELYVPRSISSDAIANNYTNIEACDLIIAMSTNWRAVQSLLRANRLLLKAQAKNSLTIDELAMVDIKWTDFINLIKLQVIE